MLAIIRFKVGGILRYLSHAEMLRVFQRACARANIPVAFSHGFNPHQKISLVLPRSVGVESDDELLCLGIEGTSSVETQSFKSAIEKQLPEGVEIFSVEIRTTKNAPVAQSAKYRIKLQKDKKPTQDIEKILKSEMLLIARTSGESSEAKSIDVRPFIKSIDIDGEDIIVDCAISPAGTIRVDEILGLLKISQEDLTGPVKRTKVEWKDN